MTTEHKPQQMPCGSISHEATLDTYEVVVGVKPLSRRPIRRNVYLVRCSCGWEVAGVRTFIGAKKLWKKHRHTVAAAW